MSTIRTKWHRIEALAREDEVYLPAPDAGYVADPRSAHWSEYGANEKMVTSWLGYLGQHIPKFVIDPDLYQLSTETQFMESLLDMKRAGVLRLPFPAMIVELPFGGVHYACLIRDLQNPEKLAWEDAPPSYEQSSLYKNVDGFPFYGFPLQINKDENGEYLVLAPSITHLDITNAEDATDPSAWLRFQCSGASFLENNPRLGSLVQSTHKKCCSIFGRSLLAAMLLMATQGIKKEVIETHRLNKNRAASNKPPIPRHTYVRIGHVYRRATGDEIEEYVPRKSPFPYWRRGHIRNVRYGKNWGEGTRPKYIYPRLRAFKGDADLAPEPKPGSYIVTN